MVRLGVPTVRYGDFEWDTTKAAANVRKHGITFEEAATVFLDDLAVPYTDPVNPDRLILIGMSLRSNLLLVIFAERCGAEVIRIISARRATRRERRAYEEGE
ncbi:MAG: BrnT family toxin [Candidatus Binatia bacterium]|jgi:uncharacterized protein